jgi:hypothetical protein
MKYLFFVLSFLGVPGTATCGAAEAAPPRHLADAKDLVQHLSLENTSYQLGGAQVRWEGRRESHSDCSGFLNALLMHSYAYSKEDFKKWFGSGRPTAARYHDAISQRKGFAEITRLQDVQPGDILAVKNRTPKRTTGHVMLAVSAPRRMQAKKPVIGNAEPWEIAVIDSSKSGHGRTDTRHAKGEGNKDHDGLGMGVLRLYADRLGKVAGYSWSTLDGSRFVDPKDQDLVIGRLISGCRP